jgi:hypothetical protein
MHRYALTTDPFPASATFSHWIAQLLADAGPVRNSRRAAVAVSLQKPMGLQRKSAKLSLQREKMAVDPGNMFGRRMLFMSTTPLPRGAMFANVLRCAESGRRQGPFRQPQIEVRPLAASRRHSLCEGYYGQ